MLNRNHYLAESAALAKDAQAAWEVFCLRHGEEAFDTLFKATSGLIFNAALRETRDSEAASDVMQQCYVELLHQSHQPDAASKDINRLALTTALREANTSRKRGQRRTKALLENAPAMTRDWLPADARSNAADEQLRSNVLSAMEHLPQKSRQVVELAFLHELSHEEIASLLNITRSAVTKRMDTARKLLAPLLRQAGVLLSVEAAVALLKSDAWAAPPDSISSHQVFERATREYARSFSAWGRIKTAASTTSAKVGASAVAFGIAALFFWPQNLTTSHLPPTGPPDSSPSARAILPAQPTLVDLGAARTQTATIVRTAAASASSGVLRGRIVSVYDQEPLMNIPLFLMALSNGSTPEPRPVDTTVSAGDGTFLFATLPHGAYRITVTPASPWVTQVVPAEINSEFPVEIGDIQLNRLGRITGRLVKMPGETGISAAKVELRNPINRTWPSSLTAADGSFEFKDLTFRNYSLIFPEHGNLYHNMTLTDSESRNVLIPLGSVSLSGRILRNNKPYTNVKAWAIRTGDGLLAKGLPITENGSFSITGLVPDVWQVVVEPKDPKLSRQKTSHVIDLRTTSAASCEVILASGVLSGTVLDHQHNPLPFALVKAITRDDTPAPSTAETTAAEDGTFEIDGLPSGTYSVYACHGLARSRPLSAVLPAEGKTDVGILTVAGQDTGRVVASAFNFTDGKPLIDAWLDVCTSSGVLFRESGRNESGVLTLTGLASGDYIFRTGAYGFSVSETTERIEAGGEVRIDAVLHEAGAVRWTITHSDGAPAKAAECTLRPVDTNSLQAEISGRTNDLGEWLVRGITPGLYDLIATDGNTNVRDKVRIHARDLAEKWSVAPISSGIVISSK